MDTLNRHETLHREALALLKQLIAVPSFSREEQGTAGLLLRFLQNKGIAAQRLLNNVWARNQYYDPHKPTLLLNAHHDTVKPNSAYTFNPFHPREKEGRLYGLGSNDAGGCLVALIAAFLYFRERRDLRYNLILAATAEEEISGTQGIEALLPELGPVDAAIVGEPTQLEMAVSEKGLLVLDCTAHGLAGHAARAEGDNAIYKAMHDIEWFSSYVFPHLSPTLGAVKMSVTMIRSGEQHNVIPASCSFTVDVRVTDTYSHEEVLATIRAHVQSEVHPRSLRLRSTTIAEDHPLVAAGRKLGRHSFGSPTLSDKALMPFPALKIGPGDSARSHIADEYIFVHEINEGIDTYIALLQQLL